MWWYGVRPLQLLTESMKYQVGTWYGQILKLNDLDSGAKINLISNLQ